MSGLDRLVRDLGRAAGRARAVTYLVHALLASATWLALVLGVARLIPVDRRLQIAIAGVPLILLACAIAWLVSRPSPPVLLLVADLRLGLKERLSTAWERRAATGPLDGHLRQDALGHAASLRPGAAFPVRIDRREGGTIAALAVIALGLAIFPNPMDRVLAQRQADRVSQARAVTAVQAAQKKVVAPASPAPVSPQVVKILQDAQATIRQADSPRQALETITPAEQKLQQLSDPQTPARNSSAQNLANALSATSAGRSAGQALSASPKQGAQSLRDLASQLQSLSPKDQQELAKALANAAQHAQDPAMSKSLQNASDSLKKGDTAAASQALNDTASQLDSLQQQNANDQAVASAINGLEAARQELASQADRDATQSGQAGAAASEAASASAQARASGSGSGSGSGTGSGSGSGTGSGGSGSGTGTGSGSGTGSGGSGSGAGTGSGSGSGSAAQSTERIYVPGQPVPGQSEDQPTPLGPGQDVPLSPYNQVINAYQQAALDAVDQSLIPGSDRELVRQYFSQLGEK
ncbi:MAG: hypothetical protein ABI401_04080 [Candidatus Dormibacter sp.]